MLVVFSMGQHFADVDSIARKIDARDEAVLIPAQIKNVASPNPVRARISLANVRELSPRHALNRLIPLLQRRPRRRMTSPKILELRVANDIQIEQTVVLIVPPIIFAECEDVKGEKEPVKRIWRLAR